MLAAPIHAQEWGFDPRLAVGGEIDDNAQLSVRTDDVSDLEGLLVEASANITYNSETTKFLIIPLVLDRTYPNDPDFDSTKIDGRMKYEYQSPRNRWQIDARFNKDQVRNAERSDIDFDDDDPDNIPNDDTALVQLVGERTRWSVRPDWAYNWSASSTTAIQFDYRDVTYDDVLGLIDYSDSRLSASHRLNFSAKTAGTISASVRKYELADDLGEFDSIGFYIGVNSKLTPKVRVRARIGVENIESAVSGLNETKPVGELTFIRQLETIRILAQYRRSVTASGAGRMSERDAINLKFTRILNERFEAGLGLRAYTSKPIALNPADPIFERNYVDLSARFTWNITRTFAFETTYRYTLADRELVGESANSNQVTAWIVFRPNGVQDQR